MLRYLAIATVLVVGIAVFVTAWSNRDLIRIRISSTNVPMPPKPAAPEDAGGLSEAPVTGNAPWALSALPDCLVQQSITRGGLAYVRAHLPAGLAPVPSGTTLVYGPCTILVTDDEAVVRRGADRLVIPPHVSLYRGANALALLRTTGETAELRVYGPPRRY